MVVFDASFLLLALRPGVRAPIDPTTRKPVEKARERVEYLIRTLTESATPVVVPAPALSETLVMAAAGVPEIVSGLRRIPAIRIADFDTRAAIECAFLTDAALSTGTKRGRAVGEPYQKVKVDRQIIAIAKVAGASTIYSSDNGLIALARAEKFNVFTVSDLPLPPLDAQGKLFES